MTLSSSESFFSLVSSGEMRACLHYTCQDSYIKWSYYRSTMSLLLSQGHILPHFAMFCLAPAWLHGTFLFHNSFLSTSHDRPDSNPKVADDYPCHDNLPRAIPVTCSGPGSNLLLFSWFFKIMLAWLQSPSLFSISPRNSAQFISFSVNSFSFI